MTCFNQRISLCHLVIVAHKVHIGQQFDIFTAFESITSATRMLRMCRSLDSLLGLWKQRMGECPARPSTHRYISTRSHINLFVAETFQIGIGKKVRNNLSIYLSVYLSHSQAHATNTMYHCNPHFI